MSLSLDPNTLREIAPEGHYIALRIGFAFPMIEVNAWPKRWIEHYRRNFLLAHDPILRWMHTQMGTTRWSEITLPDPMKVAEQAAAFNLRYGAAIVCADDGDDGIRSYASFARRDREFTDSEIAELQALLHSLHRQKAPPDNLTNAELEALRLVRDGLRHKQIAYQLGVTEGAIKQRLRNAKAKLNASTVTQAAASAHEFGLI